MRLTIIILIIVLVVGSSIISYRFITNQEKDLVVNISPYEKLQNYKEELQKINQYNQEILENLEQKVSDPDIDNLEQIREEIGVLKRVINDNKVEIEQINQKLSAIEPTS